MAENNLNARLRALPKIDEVLQHVTLPAQTLRSLPDEVVTHAAREEVEALRQRILADEELDADALLPEQVAQGAAVRVLAFAQTSLRPVVNATGVVIHTNIGRSPLAPQALEAVVDAARGYSTLEYSTDAMARGSRHDHCEALLCALTGAEAALAVNNNAAAVLMVLSEFAAGHEAVVSRGELVEIGGSFRIPDIMAASGARMVEVGTTNKTHPEDYERAIGPDTAMLLKVHTSNYQIVGFSESVPGVQLAKIAAAENARRERAGECARMLVYEDLGSGSLVPPLLARPDAEPTVRAALERACDLVSFSGDKLLGGPQAGIVVGRKDLIDRLKKNPLARALRLDKMTLAALEATLRLYLDGSAYRTVPTLRMLNEPVESIEQRAHALAKLIEQRVDAACAQCSVVKTTARAGGGSLPLEDLPSFAVKAALVRGSAAECEAFLVKDCAIPVIPRVQKDHLLFDVRTVQDGEGEVIASNLASYFESEADA
ncbi:MAG TPA: L-seryl-tRNA(Sec) selenium transferase [Candidatus Aveggerthella stercoripullorum]|uniref:L-seryl-tRNA(Sec) selenium transferase n=1 Tax=Candidatus Aveggerthella stercoripullorum TaxID=2840688 RepID=A0A9D1D2L5_9ACTN|nr:L-seryl-tRNA(Sec) selenium transferase [Candidatus Aveggerthella stercoripullorum]